MCEHKGAEVEVCGESVCGACFEAEMMAAPLVFARAPRLVPVPTGKHGNPVWVSQAEADAYFAANPNGRKR